MSASQVVNKIAAGILGAMAISSILGLLIWLFIWIFVYRDCKLYCKINCDGNEKLTNPPGADLIKKKKTDKQIKK